MEENNKTYLRNAQEAVRDFHKKAGQAAHDYPLMPPDEVRRLREKLIDEESQELKDAQTIEDVADALGDLLYVVLGAGLSYGIDLEEVFDEVHRSNMTKFIDGHRREDGKWIKGPSYTPADMKKVIEKLKNR